jgi:large repetitive protein
VKHPGERVFDVLLNGNTVLDHFDILKEAGAVDKGIDRSFTVDQADPGILEIRLKAEAQNAKVCAIEVVKQK